MSSKNSANLLKVTSPCTEDWYSMRGNDRIRFCDHCNLSVQNVSEITRKQALRLIQRSQGRLCVRYVLHPDESIEPTSIAPSLYRIGRRASRLAAGAFSATLTVSGAAVASAPSDRSLFASPVAFAERSVTSFAAVGGGVINGSIFDSNGALIPGAIVSLTNQQTKQIFTTVTNDQGEYHFEGLDGGDYTLKILARGFTTSEVTGISLRADEQACINQTLEIVGGQEVVGGVSIELPKEALVRAAQEDDIEAFKQLLASRPNVNVRDRSTGSTALEHAVLNANREMVQLLIWAGADVNARDEHGRTPLMLLGEKITSDTVWDLINAGAKVNLRDQHGDTALIEAAYWNNLEVLKTLLDAGAKVNERNEEGTSALMQAASEGLVNNVRALILAGADVNARNIEGNTAWSLALENDHGPVLRLLRSYGADENVEKQQQPKL